MPTPFRAPRFEAWSNLAAISGAVRRAFIARKYVIACTTPGAVDRVGTATLVVNAACPACVGLEPGHVVRLTRWSAGGIGASVAEYRILEAVQTAGSGASDAGRITYTLVHPLVDWTDAGRIATLIDGVPQFSISGLFTPTQALQVAIDFLAARGQPHWRARAIERNDAKQLTITAQTPLELLIAIEKAWQLEAQAVRVADADWAIDLLKKVGGDAARPHLRLSSAITRGTVRRTAATYANQIRPLGAGGATIAHAAWTVSAIAGGVLSLTDPDGGPGPIQIDGQLVGASLQRMDGARVAVTATARNDGLTSLVTVTSATGISVGDTLEFRATADGEVVTALNDPAAIAARGLVEATLERSDLGGYRNWLRNPQGLQYASPTALPDGWAGALGAGIFPESITRVTGGAIPPDCPLPVTDVWKAVITEPNRALGIGVDLTPAIDFTVSDATYSFALLLYLDGDFNAFTDDDGNRVTPPTPELGLLSNLGTARGDGAVVDVVDGDPDIGGQWFVWSRTVQLRVASLPANPIRLRPGVFFVDGNVVFPDGSVANASMPSQGVAIYIAGAAFTRGERTLTAADCVAVCEPNRLWHAANAELMSRRAVRLELQLTAIDRARVDASRFGDTPLVTGGDVDVTLPAFGLVRQRARLLSSPVNELAPESTDLLLVTAPDPVAAALEGYASPARRLTLTEQIRALLGASGSTSNGVTVATNVITPGTGGTGGSGGTGGGTGGTNGGSTGGGTGSATTLPPVWTTHTIPTAGPYERLSAAAVRTEIEHRRWPEDTTQIQAYQAYVNVPAGYEGGTGQVGLVLGTRDGGTTWEALDGAALDATAFRVPLDGSVATPFRLGPVATVAPTRRGAFVCAPFTLGGDGTLRPWIGAFGIRRLPVSLATYQGGGTSGSGGVLAGGDPCAICPLPSVTGTVVLDLDAQRLCALATGAAVTTWPDASGNARNATPLGVGATYVPGTLGSARGAVVTPGTAGDGMQVPVPPLDDFTMFFVVAGTTASGTSNAGYQNSALFYADSWGTQGDYAATVRADGRVAAEVGEFAGGITRSTVTSGSILGGPPHVVTLGRDATTGAFFVDIDGVRQATGTGITGTLSDAVTAYLGGVPAPFSANASPWPGAYGRVLVYAGALSATDRSRVEIALMDFYRISY